MAPNKNFLTIAADNGGTNSGGGAGGGGYSTLQYGSSGAGVKELQQTLNRLGYNVGTADGIFGNNTKNAVLQYQRDNGLTADGIVGANTWGALNTPVTPTSTPSVGDAVKASPGELRAETQAPTVTAKTEAALEDKKAGTTGAVSDGGENTGIPSTAGVKPTAVAYDDNGIDYKAVTDAAAAKLGLPDLPAAAPTAAEPPVTAEDIIRYYDAQTGASGGAQTAPAAQPVTAAEMLAYSDAQGGTGESPSGSRYDTPSVPDTAPSGYTPPERNPYYEPNYQRILQEMENYPAFSYDPNSDPVWASIAKQYRREGQRATQDTLGQYAAMTGGIPSTAAVTAATQAGDYYGAQLTDRLQSVYNDAYQKYLDQYTRMMGLADQYRSGMDFEEGQFTGDRNFGFNQYTDSRNFDYDKYLNERNFQYQQEQDSYSRGQNAMEDAQKRVAAYLSMGGDPANLDAEIVRQSGYSAAEMQQMRSYYAQQAALQAAKASGGSSGSGSMGSSGGGGSSGGSGNGAIENNASAPTDNDAAQLMAIFPGGIITNGRDWDTLTGMYGESWLRQNGFRLVTPKNAEPINTPTAEYGSRNYSGIDKRPSAEISTSYFEDGGDDFNSIEAEYQAALKSTVKASAFIKKYGGTTPLTEGEFNRSTGMVSQYGTYKNYIQSLMDDLMA